MSAPDEATVLLCDSARGFLAAEHSLARLRQLRTAEDGLDRAMLDRIAALGWMGMRLPEELGGAGMPLSAAAALAEVFGGVLLPEPFVTAGVLPSVLVAAMAPGAGRRELAAMIAGGRVVCAALAETINQAEPGRPGAIVERRNNGLQLDGTKLFVPAGADAFLVSARLDGETVLVRVSPHAPGLDRTTRRMTDAAVTATLRFSAVELEDDAVLLRGAEAEAAIRSAVDEATVATSAQLAGLAAAALGMTLEYMTTRQQFGRPIGSFQALQHRAVDLQLQIELAGAAWRNAVRQHQAAPDTAPARAAVSAAKARCSDAALLVCRTAIQFHGAIGYTDEADIGLYLKAAMRLASSFGNGSVHRRRFLANHHHRKEAA